MNLLQKYLAEEYVEDFQEGRISRRQALKKLAALTGSAILAQSFLAACLAAPEATPTAQPAPTQPPASPTTAVAATAEPQASATSAPAGDTPAATSPPADTPVSEATTAAPHGTVTPDDAAIFAEAIEFPGEDGAMVRGYLAYPANEGTYPVVLVCHENRGLTAHIEDVARRFGKAGYAALAVDLLSRQGGSAAVGESGASGALGNNPPEQMVSDFRSGWLWLQDKPYADTEQVGMVGFCFGGGMTWQVATQMPELKAAVPFYGPPPDASQVPNIQAAVLAVYGENDNRITSTAAAIEAEMQANGKTYSKLIYPGADHAFFNDTGQRYNAGAAEDAWAQTLAWFGQHLA